MPPARDFWIISSLTKFCSLRLWETGGCNLWATGACKEVAIFLRFSEEFLTRVCSQVTEQWLANGEDAPFVAGSFSFWTSAFGAPG